jgi:hypothetical protein
MQDTKKSVKNRLELCDSLTYDESKERIEIPYFDLSNKPVRPATTGNVFLPFVRYRNYSEKSTCKYLSPSAEKDYKGKYNTPLYYPQKLIETFLNGKIKGNTFVITEGEFKAITAQKYGINCLAFAGITMYEGFDTFYQNELAQLISTISVTVCNIVILFDADATNIKSKEGVFNNSRLFNFYQSAYKYSSKILNINTDKSIRLFVGIINHIEKGLDDLLDNLAADQQKVAIKELNNPSKKSNYFNFVEINKTTIKKQLDKLFPCMELDAFVNEYKEIIGAAQFDFTHRKKKNTSTTKTYHLDGKGTVYCQDDFYTNFNIHCDELLIYNRYIGERTTYVQNALLAHKKVLLHAPTGAGKTTMLQQLQKSNQYERIVLIVPIRSIAKQQTQAFDLHIGGETLRLDFDDDFVTTFSKFKQSKIINENDLENSLFVIDEAHELWKSFGYRGSECFYLERLAREFFKNVLFLSATPCVPFFRSIGAHCIGAEPKQLYKPKCTIHTTKTRKNKEGELDKVGLVQSYIDRSIRKGRKAYVYIVSKNNYVLNELELKNINSVLITADTSRNRNSSYYNRMLVEQQAFLDNVNVVLTNAVLETGASFNDDTNDIDVYLFFTDTTSLVQAANRFRQTDKVTYTFILEEKKTPTKYELILNDLKGKELDIIGLENGDSFDRIYSNISSSYHTYKDNFSYSKTFNLFESERNRRLTNPMQFAEIAKRFEVENTKVIEPPRMYSVSEIEPDSVLSPKDLINGGIINEKEMSNVIYKLSQDARKAIVLKQCSKGVKLFKTEGEHTDVSFCEHTTHVARLILHCYHIGELTDSSIRDRIVQYLQLCLTHYKYKIDREVFNTILNSLIYETAKKEPNTLLLIEKGKRIIFHQLMKIKRQGAESYTIAQLRFIRESSANKYRYLKILNLYSEIVFSSNNQAAAIDILNKEANNKRSEKPQDAQYQSHRKRKKIKRTYSEERINDITLTHIPLKAS